MLASVAAVALYDCTVSAGLDCGLLVAHRAGDCLCSYWVLVPFVMMFFCGIQLERLDQVGVHSYCLLVDPIQMKTHTLASALGQQFHQQQQTHQQPPSDDTATGIKAQEQCCVSACI